MFPFSHFFAGYFVGFILVVLDFVVLSNFSLVLFGFLSVFPDFDGFFNQKMKDHHKTLFHAPIFWVLVSIGFSVFVFLDFALILGFMTLFHIFTDFVTGRTIGIAPLYPFREDEYSLYSLDSETAEMNMIRPDKGILKEHLSFYVENKVLLWFELILDIFGVICLFYLIYLL